MQFMFLQLFMCFLFVGFVIDRVVPPQPFFQYIHFSIMVTMDCYVYILIIRLLLFIYCFLPSSLLLWSSHHGAEPHHIRCKSSWGHHCNPNNTRIKSNIYQIKTHNHNSNAGAQNLESIRDCKAASAPQKHLKFIITL